MTRPTLVALFAAVLLTMPTIQAQASITDTSQFSARHKRHHHHRSHVHRIRMDYDGGTIVSHPSGCPHSLFCGCGVSVKVFGHPVRDLFLAANWRRFPSASPSAGMVAWRSHHVVYIESANGDGTALVYDPNSGGRLTRIHTISLHGFRIVDPNQSRIASR